MKKLALSSEIYLIKASELKRLPRAAEINGNISGTLAASAAPQVSSREITVLLNADAAAASGDKEVVPAADVLLSGAETVSAAADRDFLPVRFAYRSYPACRRFSSI